MNKTVNLVYTADRIKGNEVFISRMSSGLRRRGIDCAVIMAEQLEFDKLPNGIVMRCFDEPLSRRLQQVGVRVFNNYRTQVSANDKWVTTGLVKSLGIPVMRSVLCEKGDDPPFFYPFVMKELDGHGGSEVFLVSSDEEYENRTALLRSEKFLAQSCADYGVDKRLYMLGTSLVCAMKRENKNDFRSNYKLGGSATQVAATDTELEYARRIAAALKSDYIGVDFVYSGDKTYLNEVEDIVGCRMVYENTDIDILDMYCEYIAEKLT